MPHPQSPFPENLDENLIFESGDAAPVKTVNRIQIDEILQWLCKSPEISSFRVNTLKWNVSDVEKRLNSYLKKIGTMDEYITVEQHEIFEDVIILRYKSQNTEIPIYDKEVIVDSACGAAVLRGAHIYAPGVLAMLSGTKVGDFVSVYVDLERKCKKGLQKVYQQRKIFIGNGEVLQTRSELFSENPSTSGVAVRIVRTMSNCPAIEVDTIFPSGSVLLQNLPSIACVRILNPEPGERVLDMCAAPGNKTTHIAALMENRGQLIALDKTPSKVERLKQRCQEFGTTVEVVQFDSTKIIEKQLFERSSFDKVLLDAPCSALGKRPQFSNTITEKVLKSYVPLQKKLFANAVELLRTGGILVYSTCTITVRENEKIVSWALKHFAQLQLEAVEPSLGGPGFPCQGLNDDDLKKLQRFGPNQVDSVGFFIAKFIKT